ncbi:MAG: hypothetical protein HY832_00735 [Candidatus Aenigmarchaeota archaeon]|nr:hypothetical protein [Candidatus Aenigmarchaeota archaeon]
MHKKYKTLTYIIPASVSFFLFALFIKLSGLSVSSLVTLMDTLVEQALVITTGLSTLAAIGFLLAPFLFIVIGFCFLMLGLAVLAAYGCREKEPEYFFVPGIVGALAVIVLCQSVLAIFIGLSLIVASFIVVTLSAAYIKELTRWIRFRTGHRAIGRALLIVNIFIAAGIFFTVLANQNVYGEQFQEKMITSMTRIATASVPTLAGNEVLIEPQIRSLISQSPMIQAYVRWIPVVSALTVWFFLELLRTFVLSVLGGFLTLLFVRETD